MKAHDSFSVGKQDVFLMIKFFGSVRRPLRLINQHSLEFCLLPTFFLSFFFFIYSCWEKMNGLGLPKHPQTSAE
jgi:hypothetical protein